MPAKPQKWPWNAFAARRVLAGSESPILSGLKAAKMTPDQIAEASGSRSKAAETEGG